MIRWEPYLWPTTPVATDEEIGAVERAWGVALPADYRAVAREHQGESPEPGGLRVAGAPHTVECLLHFRASGDHASWNLVAVDAELRDWLPLGVHPVAATTSGGFWCLDFRGAAPGTASVLHAESDDEPEDAFRTVAPDFATFLGRLRDPADQG